MGNKSIDQKPVTPRRRWGTPTDADAVVACFLQLQLEAAILIEFATDLTQLVASIW